MKKKTSQHSSDSQLNTNKQHGTKNRKKKEKKHQEENKQQNFQSHLKKITWQEVGKHDNKDDIWVVIEDKVYEVTKFVDKHPGGPKVIMERAGKKGDKTFQSGNHPMRVMQKALLKYLKGVIDEHSMINSWQRQQKTGRMDLFMSCILTFVIIGYMIYLI